MKVIILSEIPVNIDGVRYAKDSIVEITKAMYERNESLYMVANEAIGEEKIVTPLTKAELIEKATALGIEGVNKKLTNAAIEDLINAAVAPKVDNETEEEIKAILDEKIIGIDTEE